MAKTLQGQSRMLAKLTKPTNCGCEHGQTFGFSPHLILFLYQANGRVGVSDILWETVGEIQEFQTKLNGPVTFFTCKLNKIDICVIPGTIWTGSIHHHKYIFSEKRSHGRYCSGRTSPLYSVHSLVFREKTLRLAVFGSLCLSPSPSVLPCQREQGSDNAIKGAWRSSIDCSCLSTTLSYQRVSPISRRSMLSFPSSVAPRHCSQKCHKGFVETLYQMIGSSEINLLDGNILSS